MDEKTTVVLEDEKVEDKETKPTPAPKKTTTRKRSTTSSTRKRSTTTTKKPAKPKWPSPLKVDIGCGRTGWQREPLDEWVHLDIEKSSHVEVETDIGKLPFEDKEVDEIYVGDIIEHVPKWRYDEVFNEWNRVLKMGGVFNGAVPNLDRTMKAYVRREIQLHEALNSIYGFGKSQYSQHYYGYSKETVAGLMEKYGFELYDFSGSPGPSEEPWWLVFKGRKVRDV